MGMPKIKRMRKGQTKGDEKLEKPVMTRINKSKYDELCRLAAQSKGMTVSGLIRRIIHNKPVKIFVQDDSLNVLMEELAANRSEIKSIGVNINQITRYFNTYPEQQRKLFYAKMAFHHYQALTPKIDRLLMLIEKGAKKWLFE